VNPDVEEAYKKQVLQLQQDNAQLKAQLQEANAAGQAAAAQLRQQKEQKEAMARLAAHQNRLEEQVATLKAQLKQAEASRESVLSEWQALQSTSTAQIADLQLALSAAEERSSKHERSIADTEAARNKAVAASTSELERVRGQAADCSRETEALRQSLQV
jgi:chromosome segregation ATPase